MRQLGIAALLVACQGDKVAVEAAEEDTAAPAGEPGRLAWSPGVLQFTELEPGVTGSAEAIIENTGTGALLVELLAIGDSASGTFYMQESEDVELLPGESMDALVTATLAGEGYQHGALRIRSDDPEGGDVRVPLCAYSAGNAEEAACGELAGD